MPVVDHPVHEHGVRSADAHRYGCHNRPAFQGICVSSHGDTWPNRFSRECRYDRSLTDKACAGCKHAGSGEAYIAEQEARIG